MTTDLPASVRVEVIDLPASVRFVRLNDDECQGRLGLGPRVAAYRFHGEPPELSSRATRFASIALDAIALAWWSELPQVEP